MTTREFTLFLTIALIVSLTSVLFGAILIVLAFRKLRKIDIPPDAGFLDTLLLTPFSVVIAIDLLDLGLDFLSAPVSWAVLDRLGLKALRQVAVIEAIIPGTQLLPTLTLSWLFGRVLSRFN